MAARPQATRAHSKGTHHIRRRHSHLRTWITRMSPSQIILEQLEREENHSYCPERGNLAQVTQPKAAQGELSNLNKTRT